MSQNHVTEYFSVRVAVLRVACVSKITVNGGRFGCCYVDLTPTKNLHGVPYSLGNNACGCHIPCCMGDAKIPEGVPVSLGNLAWGCQILGGARFPMTPVTSSATAL